MPREGCVVLAGLPIREARPRMGGRLPDSAPHAPSLLRSKCAASSLAASAVRAVSLHQALADRLAQAPRTDGERVW